MVTMKGKHIDWDFRQAWISTRVKKTANQEDSTFWGLGCTPEAP